VRIFVGILLLLAAGVLAGALIIWSGVADVSATSAGGLPDRVLGYAAVRSIRHHSGNDQHIPDSADLKAGLQYYRAMCVACHGGPGARPADFAAGLNPPAPDLASPAVQSFTDGMLYRTVARGIRSTGMPAFGPSHSATDIWSIVAFVRHLPALSPSEREELGGAAHATAAAPAAAPTGSEGDAQRVSMSGMKFDPANLEVKAGATVEWVNGDFVSHTATAADGAFDTGEIQAGQSKRVVMGKAGSFPYACRFHPSMKGTITVR
jgi:plastocyanin